MEYLFIVGAFQAFFFSVLAWNKQSKSTGDYVMMLWFILLGIMLVAYSLEVIGIEDRFPVFWALTTGLPLLMGPVALLYVLAYTQKEQKISPLFALNALPYVFFTIIVIIKMTMYAEPTVREDIRIIEDDKVAIFAAFELARIFLGPIYLIITLIYLSRHKKRIGEYFSYTENIDLKWVRNVVLMIVLIWVTVIFMSIISNFYDFIPWRTGDNIIYLMVTATIFINGFYGIKQQIIFSPLETPPKTPEIKSDHKQSKAQYLNSGLTGQESREHLERLLQLMEGEKPYLDGKLSLAHVAGSLNISTNHLSQVINENLNKNFFDFINGYRVEMVKEKMLDPANKNLTLLGIAYDCGFNSKSSFNSIFKNYTGKTPSQFIKEKAA